MARAWLGSAAPVQSLGRLSPMPPHPSLEVLGGAADTFLPALKTLTRPYDSFPVVGWNRHVETIFAAFYRSLPQVRFRRECLRVDDGGVVALDWVSGDHRRLPPDSPLLILLGCPRQSATLQINDMANSGPMHLWTSAALGNPSRSFQIITTLKS